MHCVGLMLMRVRFRASNYGQVAKTNIVRAAKIETLLLPVRNRKRRWCSGHLFVFICPFELLRNSSYSSGRCVWRRQETRRVDFARPRTQASEPALTDYSSLAGKRSAEAFTWCFFNRACIRAQHDDYYCCCCCCCLLPLLRAISIYTQSRKTRAG